MPDKNEKKEKDLDVLYQRREALDQARINLANSFDKYLLTFATGGLYLSIVFANAFNSQGLIYKRILIWGWIALLVSIAGSLTSIVFSVLAFKKQMENTDVEISALINSKEVVGLDNCWNKAVIIFQWIAGLTFVVGITLLTCFYFKNLR